MGPVLFTYLSYPPRYLFDIELKDWVIMWVVLFVGFTLCVASDYKSENGTAAYSSNLKDSPTMLLFKVVKTAVYVMIIVFMLVMFVVGVYYAFFSKYMPIILPIIIAVCALIALLIYGWKYRCDYLKSKKNNNRNE